MISSNPNDNNGIKGQSANANNSRLLSLPPELRNAVWSYALEEGLVPVTPILRLSALFATCRQTRAETEKLWFSLNIFNLEINDFDASLLLKWTEVKYDITGTRTRHHPRLQLEESTNFDNLLQWCRWAYDGLVGAPCPHLYADEEPPTAILAAAMRIVKTCRGMSWAVCGANLQSLRAVCGAFDSAWAEP